MKRAKGIWPPPVYVAEFDDGTVGRVSFHTPAGKPFDFEAGRRSAATIFSRPEIAYQFKGSDNHQALCRSFFETYPPRVVVDGWVEHDVPGQPWVRVRDPHFEPQAEPVAKLKRPSAKKLTEAIAAAIRILEHNCPSPAHPAITVLRCAADIWPEDQGDIREAA